MASLKKLAGQTAWYGLSSIFARLLNLVLTPYLTYIFSKSTYGEMTVIYSFIPFINVVFTYGMETTFFRFMNKEGGGEKVFNTSILSLLFSTLFFTVLLVTYRGPIAAALNISHKEFITWAAWIVALDTLCTLPFAKLRNDSRPKKYASIRITGIVVNISLVYFFYSILPQYAAEHPHTYLAGWWNPKLGTGYVIIAGLVMSALNMVMLSKEFLSIRIQWDGKMWTRMMIYSVSIMIANFGGMINETFDRIMLDWWGEGDKIEKLMKVGVYGACYKISLFISLFVQAFRMGAEPFFFNQAKEKDADAKKTYARVMKYFVIAVCIMFLFVTMYIDFWKYFIQNPAMWGGLSVVPILLIANICMGVYYNLAIWYKLSDNPWQGTTITLVGVVITLVINYIFIPRYSYVACAWATLCCYFSMMVVSYLWGQKVYKVPYPVKKLTGYFFLMLLIAALDYGMRKFIDNVWLRAAISSVFFFIYLRFILKVEGNELRGLPIIGKLVKQK